jgi:hypothetical protein
MTILAPTIRQERERQLVEGLQEFLAPVPIYLNLIGDYAALGNAGGVCSAMDSLLSCMRSAIATYRELLELRDSKREAA